MRCVIFVAAIVLLVITADITGFEFGDIIYYKPSTLPPDTTYRHVAVYVGEHYFDERKKKGEVVFERAGLLKNGCFFSKLDTSRTPVVCNYLDGYVDEKGEAYRKGSDQEIEDRIKAKRGDCELYKIYRNNCEHLATYVRYGKKIALQEGLSKEGKCASEDGVNVQHILDFIDAQRKAGKLNCEVPLTA